MVSFLKAVKRSLSQSSTDPARFVVSCRDKNSGTISRLGYTREDVRQSILELSVEDYSLGPETDRAISGDVWVFGKREQGLEVYVKLKLFGDSKMVGVRLLSFHEAEAPLTYPFRRGAAPTDPTVPQEE